MFDEYKFLVYVVVFGLIYGFIRHKIKSRKLMDVLKRQANRFGGKVKSENIFLMPRWFVDFGHVKMRISGVSISNAGNDNALPIMRTFVKSDTISLSLPEFRLRSAGLSQGQDRIEKITGKDSTPTFGDPEFRKAFFLDDYDELAESVIDDELQARLLMLQKKRRLNMKVYNGCFSLSIEGISSNDDDFKLIYEAARCFAKNIIV